ncbi:hypothetical protein EW026_g8376 [Hermanssonia centrifuga]|uniref:BTB domain-containing protein n=1 Tax=Hermanssonia centrifuga TaxID=98765 RepID=A0A4S4K4C7_9APHY|nr:hypothetical protein EW026_g8376 [Hermanssonia centrifuga]
MANKAGVSEAPFNNLLSSDIVIRTSDNVDFHLHKAILSIASPFFNDMFTLPQPFPKSEDLTADPIVVSEDSQTMDGLLRLCYPVDDPIMTDLHIVGNILEAATKYLMGQPIKLATIAMQPFVETHPLQVYAIACRLKQEELAGQAAGSWKRQRIVIPGSEDFESTVGGASYIPEMAHISSGAYSRLVKYLLSPKEPAVKPTFQFCENTAISRRGKPHKLETTNSPYYAYMQELMQDADLVVRASDGFDFRVHKLNTPTGYP